ncbi:MAG TPA: bifunctional 4-hydroxy-2-oxoglutarate aldolase/2-dehydro-3-deoxy-phosphogluconate aldolase [Blastocatellia bacterium]|nr:bifunctional 4-hydroxy-2-oxoglutarate aldolase/2-dehydro-3-deoxy-phosphogluconate aldolase [Blastocatellia bacterium]
MNEAELIRLVSKRRVFAQAYAESAESALRAAEAAIIGGVKLIEVSLATPGSYRVISDLRHGYGDRATVGACSVMTFDQIDRAVKSGAQYISMPHTIPTLIETCRRHRVPAIIGALTPTEIAAAQSLGVALVTVYPVESLGGPDYMRSLAYRMPGVRLAVAGGVGPENIGDYFNAGAFAITVGGRLFARGDLQTGNYTAIAERARGIMRLAGVL